MTTSFVLLAFLAVTPPDPQVRLKERDTLRQQAGQLLEGGKADEARAAAQKALAIDREVRGPVHADVAETLELLASIDEERADWPNARKARQEVLALRGKLMGEKNWRKTEARLALVRLERLAALTPEQRERLRQARRLRQQADELYERRDYIRGEPLLRQVAETVRQLLGEDDDAYIRAISDLGVIFQDTGDVAHAEQSFRNALKLRGKVFGEDHPEYAVTLHNLGDLLRERGQYAQAEPLLLRAAAIFRDAVGEMHEDNSQHLDSIGTLYSEMEEYDKALDYRQQAAAVLEKLGQPDRVGNLHNLARLNMLRGEFDLAERQLRQVRAANMPEWPVPGAWDYGFGLLRLMRGRPAEAEPFLRESLHAVRKHLEVTFATRSEPRQLKLARYLRARLDVYLTAALAAHTPADQVYQETLGWKGAVFARQRWLRLARTHLDGDAKASRLLQELQKVSTELATLAFQTPDPKEAEARQRRINQLMEHRDELEAELSRTGAEFQDQQTLTRRTPGEIQASLPPGVALIDLLEYAQLQPNPKGKGKPRSQRHLAAFVVRSDRSVVSRDLGPADAFAVAVDRWRAAVTGQSRTATGEQESAAELRRLLWTPLEADLEGIRAVLVSPDGNLARFPLPALPGRTPRHYLIEDMPIAVVPVPQLLPQLMDSRESSKHSASRESLLLVGDVDFGTSKKPHPALPATESSGEGKVVAARGDHRLEFRPLPGAAKETEAVRARFQELFPSGTVDQLHGDGATKGAFRRLTPGRHYLHIATHGFFASAEVKSVLAPSTKPSLTGESLTGYHPGLLSGLALAGANRNPATSVDDPSSEDGILTALEVAELPLEGAELVVLSACETGLGESAGGEGLLGLQRAFQMSGARTIVASLWKVDDEATRQLMTRFYDNLWGQRMGRLEALRQAQLSVLRGEASSSSERGIGKPSGDIVVTESQGRMPPRLWAAWVLSGDPGELAGREAMDPPLASLSTEGSAWGTVVLIVLGVIILVSLGLIGWRWKILRRSSSLAGKP